MPQMFRPGGVTRMFRNIAEGEAAGYFSSFNEMAKAVRDQGVEDAAPAQSPSKAAPTPPPREAFTPQVENAPEAPPPVMDDDDVMVVPVHDDLPPPPAAPRRPLPDMELGEVKALAVKFGLDPKTHHMTLRAQVEEKLNAEVGSD